MPGAWACDVQKPRQEQKNRNRRARRAFLALLGDTDNAATGMELETMLLSEIIHAQNTTHYII